MGPNVGDVEDGYRYIGGDPGDQKSWEWAGVQRPAAGPVKLSTQEERQLAEVRNAAVNSRLASQKAGEFMGLNQKQGTGGLMAIPGVSEVLGAFNPKISTLQGLSNAMIPGMHVTPGPMTDADAKLYKSAIPNPNLPRETNANLTKSINKQYAQSNARAAFMDTWARKHGTLNGAEAAFNAWWGDYSPKVEQRLSGKTPRLPQKSAGGFQNMSDDQLKAELGL